MTISATNNTTKNMTYNPLSWAAYGLTLGAAAKGVLPVFEHEKAYYSPKDSLQQLEIAKQKITSDKVEELRQILEQNKNLSSASQEAYDVFVKNKGVSDTKNFNLSDVAKSVYSRLVQDVATEASEFEKNYKYLFKAVVKEKRSLSRYMLLGTLFTTALGFAFNSARKMFSPSV